MGKVEEVLEKEVALHRSASVQYALFDKDNILKEYRQGLADISANKAVTPKTTYNAFSVTKTVTALAVLQLAEKGMIKIEQPIQTHLQGFPYSSDITIQQLLSHSAGIPNPIPLNWIHLAGEHESFDRNKFFETIFTKNNKSKARPNQKFAYSNLGYVLLGQLIEKVTGKTYEQYISENIIERVGLTKNDLGFEIPDIGLHAKGYHKNMSVSNLVLGLFINKSTFMGKAEGKWKPFYPFYVNGTSYGGLIGTPRAFVKYIQQLLRSDNPLLSEPFKKKLFTENCTVNNKSTGMCLSWFCGQLKGHRYYAHAGGGGGYYCEIRFYPDNELGSVIFFNRSGMADERFLNKVDQLVIA